jgi:Ca-activated chloride channel family protein
MTLFSPWSLLWLVPLGGAVVALWILKLRRRDVEVPSLHLWRVLLQENQANAPFQKLRRSLLLFLQLLAIFLLVFALARPFVYAHAAPGRTIILILDTSAPMNATDVSPSRLAAAKNAADDFVDHEMGPNDVAAVIAAADRPMALTGFTTEQGHLRNAIDNAAPTDTVANMPAALTLAQSLLGGRPGAVVQIFSDGTYPAEDIGPLASQLPAGADTKFVSIGTTHPRNVAITAMDGRRDPMTGRYEVFVQVRQFGSGTYPGATLSLFQNGRLLDARALTLPGGTQSETFNSALLQQGGVITARLNGVQDDLSADNQASLVLPAPRPRKVLLVSDGNLFLERGLNLDPDVTLAEVAPADFASVGQNGLGYALVVFDDWLPTAPLPPGNYLVFHRFSGLTPLTGEGGNAPYPQFVDQSHTDPVMRFVDLEGLNLQTVPDTKVADWAQTLAETDAGPMIASGEHGGLRIVSVAFDIGDSDWPLRVSFPIFLTNAVEWLTAGGGLGASSPDTAAGGVASLTVPAGLSNVTVIRPEGSSVSLAAPPNGGIVLYDGTQQAGLYHAQAGGANYPFAVNLLDAGISSLTVQAHPELNHVAVAPAPSGPVTRLHRDFWPDLAAVALLLVVLEWIVFHRRL